MIFSLCVQSCPLNISWTTQPFFFFYQTWYGGVLSRGDMSCKKNWFTIFSVKVTVRAYLIKLKLFLQYLPNCRTVCNQTWFDSTALKARVSCGKLVYCIQCQGQSKDSKCEWLFVQMISSEPQNIFIIKLGVFMQHRKPECHAVKLVHYVQCQGHSKG